MALLFLLYLTLTISQVQYVDEVLNEEVFVEAAAGNVEEFEVGEDLFDNDEEWILEEELLGGIQAQEFVGETDIGNGDYVKKTKKHCAREKLGGRDGEATNLWVAKDKCSSNPKCGGVYDSSCDNKGTFYLCKKGFTESKSSSSCVYLKSGNGSEDPKPKPTPSKVGKCMTEDSCENTVGQCGKCLYSSQCQGGMYCCPFMKKCVVDGLTPCWVPTAKCIPTCSERKTGYPGVCKCQNADFPNNWMTASNAETEIADAMDTDNEFKVGETVQYAHEYSVPQFIRYCSVFIAGIVFAGTITLVQEKCFSSNRGGDQFEGLLIEEI